MKPRNMALWTAAASVMLVLTAGCGTSGGVGKASQDGQSKLKVVATFYPMAEFSRQVAGPYADVTGMIPAGVEPHDWEPTAKDIISLQKADVFVYNGGVEGWVDQALRSAANDKRTVVEAGQGLTDLQGVAEGTGAGATPQMDPHVWLDPVLAQKEVSAIEAALEKADPAHQADYRKNADAYKAKLSQLDQSFHSALAGSKRKIFVTQHAAFGYMAKRYGLTQVPIAGLSPEQEPAAGDLLQVIKTVKDKGIHTIFFETLVDPKVARTIADQVRAKTDVLNPLEGLTPADKQAGLDYVGIMNNNIAALKKALNE